MTWWYDVLRQCLFMSLFIIPIPIGAYTIHNGSSAAVAGVTYAVLSVFIPWAYVGMKAATFGREGLRIRRSVFLVVWAVVSLILAGGSLYMDSWWKGAFFWEWPTVGRDVVFIAGMYADVSLMMLLSCSISALTSRRCARGEAGR